MILVSPKEERGGVLYPTPRKEGREVPKGKQLGRLLMFGERESTPEIGGGKMGEHIITGGRRG